MRKLGSGGYTLIEAIVVIAVIAILSLIGITSLNFNNNRDQSRNSALDARNAVRSLQEQAQTNKIALTGPNAGQPADYYGMLLTCAGSGCGINSGAGKYVADSYKIIRVERCNSLNCVSDPTNCGATIISTTTLPRGITITVSSANAGGTVVYPRAIAFAKGSSTPQFYAVDASNNLFTLSQPTLIFTVVGASPSPTITVYASTGRVETTNTF